MLICICTLPKAMWSCWRKNTRKKKKKKKNSPAYTAAHTQVGPVLQVKHWQKEKEKKYQGHPSKPHWLFPLLLLLPPTTPLSLIPQSVNCQPQSHCQRDASTHSPLYTFSTPPSFILGNSQKSTKNRLDFFFLAWWPTSSMTSLITASEQYWTQCGIAARRQVKLGKRITRLYRLVCF